MKVLENFDFGVRVRESSYPWEQMFDGQTYHIEDADHPNCTETTFKMMAYKAGRKLGKVVQIRTHAEGGLVLRAHEATAEQIAEWAEAREKARAKGRSEDEIDEEAVPVDDDGTVVAEEEVAPEPEPEPEPVVANGKGKKAKVGAK